jgi:hypothetical protein
MILSSRIRKAAVTVTIAVSAVALTGLAATGASAATTAPAAAAAVASFHIVNFNSGLCLGISGGDDDAPAVQWPCEGAANQEWHWGSENGLFFAYRQLVNGDGQCLGVAAGSKAPGARVYGWNCNGAFNQYWFASGGQVTNLGSSLVLGVAGNSPAPGAAVVQWPFTGALNQVWTGP